MNADSIVSTLVPNNRRLAMLPKYFGAMMLRVENAIYDNMGYLCEAYKTGSSGWWDYHELSNGGFYMTPKMQGTIPLDAEVGGTTLGVKLLSFGLQTDVDMTPEAAGITVCMYTYSNLSGVNELLGKQYHLVRDFARNHREWVAIARVLD